MASFQPPRLALSAGAKSPSGVAVSPGRVVIAGNSNAKRYQQTSPQITLITLIYTDRKIVNPCSPFIRGEICFFVQSLAGRKNQMRQLRCGMRHMDIKVEIIESFWKRLWSAERGGQNRPAKRAR